MKLAIILPSLAGGGMERMRIHLIEEWIAQGIQVNLLVSRFEGALSKDIPDKVRIFELAGSNPYFFPIGFFKYIKRQQPTHILTTGHDINAMALLLVWLSGKQIPVVGSFHNHLSSELKLATGFKKIKLKASVLLMRLLLNRSQGIISVSKGVEDDLKKHLGFCRNVFHVVYNPVITNKTYQKLNESVNDPPVAQGTPLILYAGRLVHAKGLDVLIRAFSLIAQSTEAHLVLMGEGPLKAKIAAEAKAAGLEERVHFVGFQPNPLPWMRKADVFVLPSRHEGLGNVLIEALACGTQIVAADCPSGPAEILEYGRYGQLVPVEDTEALGRALLNSLNKSFQVPESMLQDRAAIFTSKGAAQLYINILQREYSFK